MIKPNWDVFNAKFSEDHQGNFEWFCYLLFCREFKKPKGIFRYKNQSAIETNPILVEGKQIGWQAKYYDVPLSKKKDELLKTLEKVKRDYSEISKVVIYTNKDWGQGKAKKENVTSSKFTDLQEPKGKVEIDNRAEELGIELEWRNSSYFESEFVSINNKVIVGSI